DFAPHGLRIKQTYTQSGAGTLEMIVGVNSDGAGSDHPRWGGLLVEGSVGLAGHLRITLVGDAPHDATIPLIFFAGTRKGTFRDVTVTGLEGSSYSLIYGPHFVALKLGR